MRVALSAPPLPSSHAPSLPPSLPSGGAFLLGTYDAETESMNITSPDLNVIDSGGAYHWAASGNDGPDPETDVGRLLTVAWVGNKPSVLSSIRELKWDATTAQLVSYPVAEYGILHNATFVDNEDLGPLQPGTTKELDGIPAGLGGALDVGASFWIQRAGTFGVGARCAAASTSTTSTTTPDCALLASFAVTKGSSSDDEWDVAITFNGKTKASLRLAAGDQSRLDVRLLVDRPLVEIFAAGGRAAFTFADTTFSESRTGIVMFNTDAQVAAQNVTVHGMGCGWVDALPVPKP